MIRIFDSMSKTKKQLTTNKVVNLYLCGPTVYNYIHIGNIRPVIIIDVLHRLLINEKYQINYVHNITDIDDKIIDQAKKEKITEAKISNKYFHAYLADLKTLNILLPTKMPRVTNYISENIKFIETLIALKSAYIAKNDVYFEVDKVASYGALANKKLDELIPNFRTNKEAKKSPFDFALWKDTEIGINWNSPWGKGRPGWHTECVTFIEILFGGKTINLHGGGIDLKFPHHENERVQFLVKHNQPLANIWWHNGHVNLDNEKMSKSLNNVILVKDFCQKYQANVLRYLILNHDHQQPINFTEQLIVEAVNTIKKYQTILQLWSYQLFNNAIKVKPKVKFNKKYYQLVINYLSDNINTTNVLTTISNMIKELHDKISKTDFSEPSQAIFQTLIFTFEILGFTFQFGNYSKAVQTKIKNWEALKAKKDFKKADLIRTELQALGVLPKN